jgi:hypothetical protein
MKNLIAVLLVVSLVAVFYLARGRAQVEPATVQFLAPPAVQFVEPPQELPPLRRVGEDALLAEIARVRQAIEADAVMWEKQVTELRARYEQAQQEANARLADKKAQLADLERQLQEIRAKQPSKPMKAFAPPNLSGIEEKLDLILKRLDSMEQRLQKLEGKPEPLKGPKID